MDRQDERDDHVIILSILFIHVNKMVMLDDHS